MDEPTCNRCGRCCYYEKEGAWRKCRFLVHHGSISSCRIWHSPSRVGTEIDDGIFCNQIVDLPHTYVGCPYNREKPIMLVQIGRYDLNTRPSESSKEEPRRQEKVEQQA